MNELKCIAGCKHFTGGEVRHHEDCPYYPESFSKMYDDLKAEVKKLNTQLVSKSEGLQGWELLMAYNWFLMNKHNMLYWFEQRDADEFLRQQ